MSATFYDRALINKIKRWTENLDIRIYSPEETRHLFETIADTTDDSSIKLPIVCLRRDGYTILNTSKRPETYDGIKQYGEKGVVQLNHVPISLTYQLDVYAKYAEEADAYMREFIFNLINSPTVDVIVPYLNANIVQRSALSVGDTVDDNSSIPERLIPGQFTRLSISITIPDAHLFDTRVKGYVKINEGHLLIVSDVDDIVVEELDLADINLEISKEIGKTYEKNYYQ